MGALLKFIFTVPFIALLFWLTFANRTEITLTWSPVHEPVTIAISVLLLGAVSLGFIWGAVITWLNYAPLRRVHRQNKKAVTRLEKELNVARTSQPDIAAPATRLSPPPVPSQP